MPNGGLSRALGALRTGRRSRLLLALPHRVVCGIIPFPTGALAIWSNAMDTVNEATTWARCGVAVPPAIAAGKPIPTALVFKCSANVRTLVSCRLYIKIEKDALAAALLEGVFRIGKWLLLPLVPWSYVAYVAGVECEV